MTSRNLLSVLLCFCDYAYCVTHAFKTPSRLTTEMLLPAGKQDFKTSPTHIEKCRCIEKLQMYLVHMKTFNYTEEVHYFIGVKNCLCYGVRTAHWQCLVIPGMPTGMKRKLFFSNAVTYNPNIFHSKFHQRMSLCQNPNSRQVLRAEVELQCKKSIT